MEVIESNLRTADRDFLDNRARMEALVRELKELLRRARAGGGDRAVELHRSRGKLLARERIDALVDADTPFLELSPCRPGIVRRPGGVRRYRHRGWRGAGQRGGDCRQRRHGQGRHLLPHHRQEAPSRPGNRPGEPPALHLLGGFRRGLPALAGRGISRPRPLRRIFYNQAQMSALGIPQVAVVMGSCTAGGAYIPAMSDEVVMVRQQGTIFLGGPPLVRAATGEEVDPETLGGSDVHTRVSGVADHQAAADEDALAITRDIVENFVRRREPPFEVAAPELPEYDPAELYGIVSPDNRRQYDVREVIARIVDGSRFHEFKAGYGETLVCGFARVWGYPVGVVANNGVLFSESALKGSHFIELCSQRGIPLLFPAKHHRLHGGPPV